MKGYLKIPILFFLGALSFSANTQGLNFEKNIISQDSVILKNEFSAGVIAHTHGLGGLIRTGKNLTVFKRRSLEFELVSMRSAKQYKMLNPYFVNAKSFYFGKLNQLYLLKAGVAEHRLITRKPYWGGIELRYFYSAGVSIGIAKPVYLYILKLVDQQTYESKSERYNPDTHSIEDIYGRAPFINGLNEIKIYPGGYAKLGLSFELAGYKSKPNIAEIGMGLDAFPFAIPLMAHNSDNHFFFTFFLNYQFGKRFNK